MKTTLVSFILFANALLIAGAAPFSSKEEKLPAVVINETREQILRCFGTNHVKGVPLLDRDVEWNWFTNWPSEFSYQGLIYTLQLTDISGGDYFVDLGSRNEVRPGMRLLAVYNHSNKKGSGLKIGGQWDHEGSLTMRMVQLNGKYVFMHQFHPVGRLYQFVRDDALRNYLIDWFDRRGDLVGTTRGSAYRWRGQEVDHEQFRTERRKVYNEFAQ